LDAFSFHHPHLTMIRIFANRRLSLLGACALIFTLSLPGITQAKTMLRISTPAVPDDWHAKMWTVFKDSLEKSAPGEFDVQINLNAALFKQGAEPTAMARGNLELSTVSAADIAKQVPEFSIFTAGYVVRDPAQQQKIFSGPIGAELFKTVSTKWTSRLWPPPTLARANSTCAKSEMLKPRRISKA
jgi:TRAP-type C4-dicarboxylate transport system substrate-binding protein